MKKFNLFLIFTIIIFFSVSNLSVFAYTPTSELHCKAILIANADTGEILYQANTSERMYPASLTKIMTAILALEKTKDLDDVTLTAPKYVFDQLYGLGGSTAGIKSGEVMSMRDMLACLLIPSANEAAMIIADHFGDGDISKFVDMMNAKAKELGMNDTHFVNPHGLHEEDHYTTAKDIYILTKYALKNPIFKEYVGTVRYTTKKTNLSDERVLATTNLMMDKALGVEYYYKSPDGSRIITGVKTGYTIPAGRCFVSTASFNGVNLMTVCMGGPTTDSNGNTISKNYAFIDTESLLDWAFTTFSYKKVLTKDEQLAEIKDVQLSSKTTSVILYPEKELTSYIPNNVDATSVVKTCVGVPKTVNAPIKKGDVLGEVVLTLADKELGRINLIATEDIERDEFLYVLRGVKNIVGSPQFIITFSAITLIIVLYIWAAIRMNKKKKNKLDYIGKKQEDRYMSSKDDYDDFYES